MNLKASSQPEATFPNCDNLHLLCLIDVELSSAEESELLYVKDKLSMDTKIIKLTMHRVSNRSV